MNRPRVAVDTNLLLLLIVGITSRDFIAKHKRLNTFVAADFDLLLQQLSHADQIVLTPNVLTETSNLVDHIAEPMRSRIYAQFAALIGQSLACEIYVPTLRLTGHPTFSRLGVSDSALLELVEQGVVLLTVDLDLFLAAVSTVAGQSAINFNNLREPNLLR
ncbi:PIN domain-containing protein [Comamonas sp. BIGb0124]|uniref:PIN domain-containing protein n=1 Tax=Comamonas sp. BIGb0124 TaxID=2485130 RepID=UPI000F4780A1|nr:PIN domain-containing protein [Comamonas sp. BIGb0124]